MPIRRSLLDRLLKRFTPRPVIDFAPQPKELAPGLWVLDRELRFPGGARLPSRTTIIRLGDGKLVVISPPPLVPGVVAAIDSMGDVAQVVAPNSFHYIYAAEFVAHYRDANLLVAPGLFERTPELPAGEEFGASPPRAWSGDLDISVLGPVRGISEVVFFHIPSRSLILTDIAFNMIGSASTLDRIVWRLSGIQYGFGPGRTSRRLLLRDHVEASRCLSRVSQWPIRRILVAHGEAIEQDAKERFLEAFASYVANPPATAT